jgi:hypothetical protein
VGRRWVRQLAEIPRIGPAEPKDPEWYPLQHHFGLTAFGANVYVSRAAGDELIGAHDELHSGHKELYYVASGRARFTLDVKRGRSMRELSSRSRLGRFGGRRSPSRPAWRSAERPLFTSSWNPRHFEGVPRAE